MPVSQPETSPKHAAGPSSRSESYYLDWIGELSQFHRAGMLNDEDFAYQRAERLEELLDTPRRHWLAWVRIGVPLSGVAGAVAWWFTEDLWTILGAGAAVILCVLAALSRLSRERFGHLTIKERSDILYHLLSEDLITSEEFLAFDTRLTGRIKR
jgi:hypothetical protein